MRHLNGTQPLIILLIIAVFDNKNKCIEETANRFGEYSLILSTENEMIVEKIATSSCWLEQRLKTRKNLV